MDLNLTKEVYSIVEEIRNPVTEDEISKYGKYKEIEDKSYKLRVIIKSWEKQQEEERKLRSNYAYWLLAGLFLQVLILYVSFFLLGLNYLNFDKWVINIFVVSVFGETIALVMVIIHNLFPKNISGIMDIVKDV